jgi:ABC-type branched-subunit amino acid transport system ATPase component
VTATLEVRDVVVEFGGVRALDGLSFSLEPGEIAGFIGPNGSGKTTLLNVISGIVRPQRGQVLIDGRPLDGLLPERRAALGLVRSFQDGRLFPELSVEETVLITQDARRPSGILSAALRLPVERRAEQEKRGTVEEIIRGLGLERFRDNTISELSTGTRRVVDLAAILAARPRVLLLDEPTSGIAQREAEAFGPLLHRLHDVTGATVCLVEHDVPLVLSLCRHVFVMEAGRIVTSGSPDEVRRDPAAVAAYLGASPEALARSGLARASSRPTSARRAPARRAAKGPAAGRARTRAAKRPPRG